MRLIPPANLTQACDPLEPLQANATMGDLLRYTVGIVGQYQECSARQEGLAAWVKP